MNPDTPKKRRVYRLPPCPAYDVEGTESWLSDMAREGLHLAPDGFLLGFAAFERGAPAQVRYRLAASLRQPGLLDESGGGPDPEAVELGREMGWEYVARRGDFYLYRTARPGARELNTDPAVQAIALREVRRRRRGAALGPLFWLALCLFALSRAGLLRSIILAGTGFSLLAAALALWALGDSLGEAVRLGRLEKKLRAGQPPDHRKDWRKSAAFHRGKGLVQLAAVLLWVGMLLHGWSLSVLEEDRIPLADYQGDPPFATLLDFAGGQGQYTATMLGKGFNSVREWEDWLAPYNARWSEQARIVRPDGTVLEGGLFLDYHKAANPWVAQELAREYLRADLRQEGAVPLDPPSLGADYAAACLDGLGFPTVVIRRGSIVVHASFLDFSSPQPAQELEPWASILADSLGAG